LLGLISLLEAIPDPNVPVYAFSTSSAMLGSPGQALYAAANAAVDAIAVHAKYYFAQNVVSLQWGGWASSVANSMSAKFGLKPIDGCERYFKAQEGLIAMQKCIECSDVDVMGICDIYDWGLYAEKTQISLPQLSLLLPQIESGSWIPSDEQLLDPKLKWIGDHTDGTGQPLIPATGLLGGLFSATSGGEFKSLKNVKFLQPLRLARHYSVDRLGDSLCIRSWSPNSEGGKSVNAVAEVSVGSEFSLVGKRLLSYMRNTSVNKGTKKSVRKMYKQLRKGGFAYGPSFKLVKNAYINNGFVFAEISDPFAQKIFSNAKCFWSLSRVLDAGTHVASLLDIRASSAFPARIGEIMIHQIKAAEFDNFSSNNPASFFVGMELRSNEMNNEVVVDLIVLGQDVTVVFDQLVLIPVDSRGLEEPLVCLGLKPGQSDFERIEWLEKNTRKNPIIQGEFEIIPTGSDLEVKHVVMKKHTPVLGKKEIRVKVSSYGLSFLDILATTGVMPPSMFGGEFAGTVVAVGKQVKSVKVGDRVACVCPGGFKSELNINVSFSAKIPEKNSFQNAASIPVSVCTGLFAIERGQVRSGMTVLVHNASGALGMAVIAVLKQKFKKIRIIGTCSKGKVEVVQNLGVSDILDSRDVSTWDRSMIGTMDVSIGAMHPDLLESTLPLLKSFGTIVDVGKRLQVEDVKLGLSPFVRGLTYTTAHLDELMRVDLPKVHLLMREAFKANVDLPVKEYSVEEIDEALKFLSSGSHVGKVVVNLGERDLSEPVAVSDQSVDDKVGLDRLSIEAVKTVFPNRSRVIVENLKNLNIDSVNRDTEIVWVDSAGLAGLGSVFNRIPESVRQMAHIAILRESELIGPKCVHPSLRAARKQFSTETQSMSGVGRSEREWLYQAVGKLIGEHAITSDQEKATFESLGIDSLGRLQLWHSFKRQFPHSKLSSPFSNSTCLKSFFDGKVGADREAGARKRWLAIHGFRTNAVVIQHQLAELVGALGDVEIVTVQASHRARGPCPDGIEEGFEWWSNPNAVSYHEGWIGDDGLEKSVDEIVKFVKENGDFDCVVGFSQGGGMAHYLVNAGLVTRGLLFSPVLPRTRDGWIKHVNDEKIVVVYDTADGTVGEYPMDRMQKFTHSEGHKIPKMKDETLKAIRQL
jgi:NADPH:quinone reductase-like Zn-dependent oxidoreductase/predicted esterase